MKRLPPYMKVTTINLEYTSQLLLIVSFLARLMATRVYYSDGYCFDIIWERQWDEDGKEMEPHYEFIEGIFDGFKSLTVEQAIELI